MKPNQLKSKGRFLHEVAFFCLVAMSLCFWSGCSNSNPAPGATATPGSSSSSAAQAISGLPDPCSLITQSELETALGKGATMTSSLNPRLGEQQCRVKPANPGTIDVIIVMVHRADNWDGIKKAVLPPSSDGRQVSGLGDDAFEGRAVGYNVRKGSKYVQVFGAVTNNDAANEKATRYLAEKAVSRL